MAAIVLNGTTGEKHTCSSTPPNMYNSVWSIVYCECNVKGTARIFEEACRRIFLKDPLELTMGCHAPI